MHFVLGALGLARREESLLCSIVPDAPYTQPPRQDALPRKGKLHPESLADLVNGPRVFLCHAT